MRKTAYSKQFREARVKRNLKLRLLALILALALLWYSVNPAPYTVTRGKDEDAQPDEKKRKRLPEMSRAPLSLQLYGLSRVETSNALPSTTEETDDDWPEFIDG